MTGLLCISTSVRVEIHNTGLGCIGDCSKVVIVIIVIVIILVLRVNRNDRGGQAV